MTGKFAIALGAAALAVLSGCGAIMNMSETESARRCSCAARGGTWYTADDMEFMFGGVHMIGSCLYADMSHEAYCEAEWARLRAIYGDSIYSPPACCR